MAEDAREETLDGYAYKVWLAASRIMKRYRHVGQVGDRLVDEFDLTPPQLFAIEELHDSGPVTMGRLADALGVTQGVATRMVDRLMEKGMVDRWRDESDRRVVMVSTTERGTGVAELLVDNGVNVLKRIFEGVSERDREAFLELLDRISRIGE